jgi:hypothetical protein
MAKKIEMSLDPRKKRQPDLAALDEFVKPISQAAAAPLPEFRTVPDEREQGDVVSLAESRPMLEEERLPAMREEEGSETFSRKEGRGRARLQQKKLPVKTKRLTIDLPVDLHKRVKRACLEKDVDMTVEIRRILERNFPAEKASSTASP